jgi:hypothetical protein
MEEVRGWPGQNYKTCQDKEVDDLNAQPSVRGGVVVVAAVV